MKSLRIFFLGGLMSYRALFSFMSPAVFIPTLMVTPIFQILLFAYIGRATATMSERRMVTSPTMAAILSISTGGVSARETADVDDDSRAT